MLRLRRTCGFVAASADPGWSATPLTEAAQIAFAQAPRPGGDRAPLIRWLRVIPFSVGTLSRVADADDVRAIALGLPDVVEIPSDGFDFRVSNRGFVWSYPEGFGRGRHIRTDIAVLFVGDEAEKQALLRGEPDLFFTTPSYEPFARVMLRLDLVDAGRLRELVTDAWDMRRTGG